jgi:MFS family permease
VSSTAPDAVARPAGVAARLPLVAPLARRDFRLVWFGEGISLLGDQFHIVALAALVLSMTGSGLALGVVLIAAAIPRGIFMLLGGALSDRVSPRDLALVSNVFRAIVTTVIAGLVLGAQVEIWQLAAAGVVFGTVDAVFLPAINTLIPRLVPADRLPAANAIMYATAQLTGTVGPAVAGFAVALIGPGAAFALDAASFAIAAVMLWLVRGGAVPGRPDEGPAHVPNAATAALDAPAETVLGGTIADAASDVPAESRPSLLASVGAGARAVLGDPVMRSIVILSTAANLAFTGPAVVGLPWLVLVRFDAGPAALGLVLAAFGAGSLVGAILAGSLPRPRRFGSVVLALVLGMGIGLAATGLVPGVVPLAFVVAATGAMSGWINVAVIAWVQGRADPAMLGRTMSFLMLGSVVAAPVSLVIASAVVDAYATPLYMVSGAIVLAAGAIGLASGLPRAMR